jgi:hypothetical protein
MISEKAATYRQHAAQCREEAERRDNLKDKVAWETGERCWLHMAEQAEVTFSGEPKNIERGAGQFSRLVPPTVSSASRSLRPRHTASREHHHHYDGHRQREQDREPQV